MAARTISELADWDGPLNQQRQSSKWRGSSSGLARDPCYSPLESQPVDTFQPPGNFSDQRRAEQSAFPSDLDRELLANSPANARPPSRVDTTPTPLHDIHHPHQASIVHTAPNSALQSSHFIAASKSSHFTPDSSVHASRVHNPRPVSSRELIAPPQPASTMESEVIDLTLEDTEDELFLRDMLVPRSTNSNDHYADPGPSRQTLSSGRSSPIAPEQSLFTPPPPSRRRTRLFIDYVAAPSFPKGLTKVDYQPMFNHSVVPLPVLTVPSTLRHSSLAESPVARERTTKGKERELDVVSSRKKHKRHSPANEADVIPNAFLDAFREHTMIPLYDDDTYPPLTTLDLITNTRFQFAHTWREHASRLREAGLDLVFKFGLLGKSCTWAQSVNTSSPRLPRTAGYVSSEQLRPWELVLPESSPQEKSTKHVSNEQAHATEGHAAVEVDASYLPLPDGALAVPSAAFDPGLSDSTVSQVVDMEHDMHQYFNGLSDSPAKHVPSRQQLVPTHTFSPHLLQSAGHVQMNPPGLEFPSLGLDPRLADTGDHECFLGVPPSPPPVDTESSTAPGPIPDPPQPVNYFPASPGNIFDASPTDAWSFERGEGFLPDNDSPSNNHVTPAALGTIDPSLLGPEQSQKQSRAPTDSTPKRRSKLPDPVIYIRRPIDSSSLPLLSGKRSVQIKYRDSGGYSATPSTQTGSNEAPSNPARNSKQSSSDTDDSPRAKRRSVPSRKLREYHTASESDSDYVPETFTSTSKIKLKLKRPSLKDKELVVEHKGVGAEAVPTMSFCHQCRNKSIRPKMLCSNVVQGRVCGKRFCNRCILYRYPDVTFDGDSAGFLCPVCTNTCNCSHCSRNRGEEFVSMRLGGLATSLFKTKVTLVRDAGEPLHRTQSPPRNVDARRSASAAMTTPEPGAPPTQSQFWAHVYGIEGERMGSAFMTREYMERLQAPGPSPPPPLPKQTKKARKPTKRDKERGKPRGPRVFVGRPLESWKVRAVHDLEPSIDVETRGKEKETGEGISRADRRRRYYIGSPAPLYEPYGRMPGTASPTPPQSRCSTPVFDSDASLTPLSELGAEADYWPQPEVGECCSWAPPLPPGTIVHPGLSDPSGPSGPFAKELAHPGPSGAVGMWPEMDGPQGLGLGSGSGTEMDVDVGDEPASASTALSEEDLARAIGAALATLSVGPPS